MAMYLRAPKHELVGPANRGIGDPVMYSVNVAMHDECAEALGVSGHPWDEGREAFSALAGQDLCWSPGPYSMGDAPDYAPTHPCYLCGEGC